MDFIVDSSVVAKWVLNEPGGEKARELIASHIFLRAPDLIISELANIFWKKAIRGDLTSEEAVERFDNILRDHIDVTVHLLPAKIVTKRALQIALTTRRSAYDCLYLAAAIQARCRLVTADERFVRSIKDSTLQRSIVSLSDAF